jgi:nucleotide sugar dehydrogenase
MYKISIIGSGLVGGAMGKVFAKYYEVIFYDIDRGRLEEIASEGYKTCESLEEAILSTNISFLCVPTPTVDMKIDLHYIEDVCSEIMGILSLKEDYHTIAIKSTIPPGAAKRLVNRFGGGNYGYCTNPEFLRSETPEEDFENQDVIIGKIKGNEKAADVLKSFYADFRKMVRKEFEILLIDVNTATMIKYTSNCLLATKISLFNEIAEICEKIGVNPRDVVRHAISDKYSTIEWYRRDFLSSGFQDECLPKDLDAFISFCEGLEYDPGLLRVVREVNERKIKGSGYC